MMNEVDRVMKILEGVCPDCSGPLSLVTVAGDPEFLLEHGDQPDGIEIEQWKPSRDGMGERGSFVFYCLANRERQEVFALPNGDWVAA